ncbi:hypothetical protein CHBEV_309 [Choristoneura biennis entomopoxvirus]|uniref:Uncharacterized protein n=1 Tax=Choristoneura biennis entomopoxvirus TaxID=10288 RepID=A0A916KPU9_CBEPV|nr:hypothetical protein CHBEV_309 [Choristoneura biennis entomopoxvirus]CCU55877.1 hypothetical protein CHBEV_309 [Choristoneura biennis entomopoxvirus]
MKYKWIMLFEKYVYNQHFYTQKQQYDMQYLLNIIITCKFFIEKIDKNKSNFTSWKL